MSRLVIILSLFGLSTLSCGVFAEDLSCPAEPAPSTPSNPAQLFDPSLAWDCALPPAPVVSAEQPLGCSSPIEPVVPPAFFIGNATPEQLREYEQINAPAEPMPQVETATIAEPQTAEPDVTYCGVAPLREFQLNLAPSLATPAIEPETPAATPIFFDAVSCIAPPEKTDAEKHATWIAELNSDDSEVRTAAFEALSEAGEAAIPAVKEAFLKPASLEQAQRLSTLLIRGEGFGPETSAVALRAAGTRKHLRAGDALEMTITIANRGKTSRNLNIVLASTDGQTLNQVNYIPVSAYDLLQNNTNDVQQQQGMPQGNTWNRSPSPTGYYVESKSTLVQTIQIRLTEDILNALKPTRSKSGEYALLAQAIPIAHYYYESREEVEANNVVIKSRPIQFQIE